MVSPPNSQTRVSALADHNDDPYQPLSGNFPKYETSFLEAIDQAMRVSPKDRIQSAKEWLTLIAQESKKVKTVNIPENKSLTKTISELIEETNKHVLTAKPQEQVVVPMASPASRSETYRPEWVDEFNQETIEVTERKRFEAKRAAALKITRLAEEARLVVKARLVREAKEHALRRLEKENVAKSRNILDWASRSNPA